MRRIAILLLLLGCAKPQVPAPPAAAPAPAAASPTDAPERQSLLDIARGATVVSRTGEAILDVSALRAVDGEPGSFWTNPPGDLPQSMVVELPARSRIDRVGIRGESNRGFPANHVQFDTSDDGKTFTPLKEIHAAVSADAQWFDAGPADARFVRVTIIDSVRPDYVRLHSALAAGRELEPPHPGDIDGCWSVNGRGTAFVRKGARVVGTMQIGNLPVHFDGGFDGLIYRLNWIRGNDFGLALLSVAPGSERLSGIEWHEEAVPLFYGDSWFGQKARCGTALAMTDSVGALLRRVGRFSLYGLHFRPDGSLDLQASADLLKELSAMLRKGGGGLRFVAHEFRQSTPTADRQYTQRELDALRSQLQAAGADLNGVEFVAQGSDSPRQQPDTTSMRALYSSVDLEIRR